MIDQLTAPFRATETVREVDETLAGAAEVELTGAHQTIDFLQESLAELEMMLEDRGWQTLSRFGDLQFSRRGIQNAAQLCRVMAAANPLIRRGVSLRTAYVWGGGVTIAARAQGGNEGQQDVNAVVQAFLDDRDVKKRLTGSTARETNERTLATDGNLFAALFTQPVTGRVVPRLIPLEEITEVVKNPQDRSEPWLYRRVSIDATGNTQTTYHPDIDWSPAMKLLLRRDATQLGALALEPGEILWDAPILHLKVNAQAEWDFGIGDAFTAIAWARAYKEFLEDWAKLVKALSRFAWRATSTRKGAAQKVAQAIDARQQPATFGTGDPRGVGETISTVGTTLEAIPKTGATIDSGSGRPLAAMVAAGMDVPVTMLLADPGVTGARATAETLDTPTELMASLRRGAWTEFYTRMLDYVIDSAVRAPQGALAGSVTRDEWGRQVVTLDGDTKRTLDIDWPDLSDTPIDILMKAIDLADGIDKLPPLLIVRLILAAFNVSDADEWLAKVTDPTTGEFMDPSPGSAGDQAVKAHNAGTDPASLFGDQPAG